MLPPPGFKVNARNLVTTINARLLGLYCGTAHSIVITQLRVVTVICLAVTLATVGVWYRACDFRLSRPQYLALVLPYFLVGIGLLRRQAFQWILALPIGGWIPVSGGALLLGLWGRGELLVLVLTILFFSSHTALAWMAIKELRDGEYRNYYFMPVSLLAGATLFTLTVFVSIILPLKD